MTVHDADDDLHAYPQRQDSPVPRPLKRPMALLAVVAALPLALQGALAAEPAAQEPSASQPQAAERATALTPEPPAAAPPPSPAVLALGRHLALDCASCHRLDGVENGIPSINGWTSERLAAVLEAYRSGERRNPVMGSVARTLSPEQVEALGAYTARLGKR